MTPEQKARVSIDALLQQAGWHVCNVSDANIHAATGVAIREFPLNTGFGFADYLLYVNGKACGVIEAKKQGATLTGVELQSSRYAQGLPNSLPAWAHPLPFVWESTGVETHFTNGLDPEPRARAVFAFFRPELLVQWLAYVPSAANGNTAQETPGTFLARMQHMPKLVTEWGSGGAHYQLWPAQISAITNLEKSLAANKPKALIQMATGSGKTFTSIGFIYRLIKFGGARRVLFLVDRGNLARQTKKEFDAYASPYNNYKFGEEYIVQHLQGNQLDTSARVVICTIQRMFSMLKGRELADEADEESTEKIETLFKDPDPIRPRLESHYAQKDFWTRAIGFTTTTAGQLNKAHVQFLESRLIALARAAKRMPLDNANQPAEPSLSEADRADMEVFLGHMLGMLPVLGVHAFEQAPKAPAAKASPVLTCKGKGVQATGYEASQGFVVRAGSQAVLDTVPSMALHVRGMYDLRQELIGNGVLGLQGGLYQFTQDYSFSSPSTAAAVVLGRSANGRIEWKAADGRTLKELQEAEAAQ